MCLRQAGLRAEHADHGVVARLEEVVVARIDEQGKPQLGASTGGGAPGSLDADHRDGRAADRDARADELRVGAEHAPPQPFADHHHGFDANPGVVIKERAAAYRLHSELAKQSRRHRYAVDADAVAVGSLHRVRQLRVATHRAVHALLVGIHLEHAVGEALAGPDGDGVVGIGPPARTL